MDDAEDDYDEEGPFVLLQGAVEQFSIRVAHRYRLPARAPVRPARPNNRCSWSPWPPGCDPRHRRHAERHLGGAPATAPRAFGAFVLGLRVVVARDPVRGPDASRSSDGRDDRALLSVWTAGSTSDKWKRSGRATAREPLGCISCRGRGLVKLSPGRLPHDWPPWLTS